jgi:hypothetical protein
MYHVVRCYCGNGWIELVTGSLENTKVWVEAELRHRFEEPEEWHLWSWWHRKTESKDQWCFGVTVLEPIKLRDGLTMENTPVAEVTIETLEPIAV